MLTIVREIIKAENSSCCLCSDGKYINIYGNRNSESFDSEEEAVNSFLVYLRQKKFWTKYNTSNQKTKFGTGYNK